MAGGNELYHVWAKNEKGQGRMEMSRVREIDKNFVDLKKQKRAYTYNNRKN